MSYLIRMIFILIFALFLVFNLARAVSDDAMLNHFKGKTIVDNGIAVKAPDIAENGSVVSVGLVVNALPPGTYIQKVWFFKAYIPETPIATFDLTQNVKADGMTIRVRLSKTTDVVLFAELSDGTVLRARKPVKVTIGGCGGGGYYEGGSSTSSYTPAVTVSPVPTSSVSTQHYGAQGGILTAGDIDDNLNFSAFLRFFKRFGLQQTYPVLDDRITLLVRDPAGRAIQQAQIEINASNTPGDQAQTPVRGYTGAQGQYHLFPRLHGFPTGNIYNIRVITPPPAAKEYRVTLNTDQLDSTRQYIVNVQESYAQHARKLDIMFVFDTTGSMTDELHFLNAEFSSIVESLRHRYPQLAMRFGLTVYRDHGDEYVVRNLGFTPDSHTMQQWIQSQHADGGGDYPEAMDEAIAAALSADWRQDETVKLLFLIADAPPHEQNMRIAFSHAKQASSQGIRLFPVAASGVADIAEQFMRVSAVISHGRYLFLTDDSGVGNSHAEPKIPCYLVTRLNQLIVRAISSEISGERLEPKQSEIIRQVGIYQNGMCR